MDGIFEADKLVLFIAFVVPGFIALKCYQLLFPGREQPTADQLVDAVAYSALNYVPLSIPIVLVEQSQLAATRPWAYYAFYAFVVFIAPVIWVVIWKLIRRSKWFQRHAPHPTGKPWDYVFSQRKAYWVKVRLKDGTIIGGRYDDKSFASSAPDPEQIYLEETWVLDADGAFERPKNETAGVIVVADIASIEFRVLHRGQNKGGQNDRGNPGANSQGLPTFNPS